MYPEIKTLNMDKKVVHINEAPAPIGPYNQAIRTGNLLFISGQIALVPGTEILANESIAAETHQVMKNLSALLQSQNAGFANVVKTTIFLTNMSLFSEVNEIYGQYFTGEYPARETVAVKGLPKNVNVEISMIAAL